MDACSKIGVPQPIPDTGSLKGDISALAEALAKGLRSAAWPAVLPSIIDAAERDPELARLHATLHASLMVPWLTVARRAKKRGELMVRQTPEELVASIIGPLYYRRWFSKEPIDDHFVKNLVRSLCKNESP
jgi:hypothetical protein